MSAVPTTDRSGVTIHFETSGDRDDVPLLLVNGLGSQLVGWDPVLIDALLARGLFVIVFDNRDVGLSQWFDDHPVDAIAAMAAGAAGEPVDAPYRLTDMAADGVAVLDELGVSRAHVVGVSMGGMIAQTMAIEHPDRVATLTSIMSSTGDRDLPGPTPEAQRALLQPPASEREVAIANSIAGARAIGSPEHFDEEFARWRAETAYDRAYHPAGVARQLAGIVASGSRSDALASLAVPTLVIHGAADPLVPVEAGRRTAERIPNAELLEIEGMGHDMPRVFHPRIVEAIVSLIQTQEVAV